MTDNPYENIFNKNNDISSENSQKIPVNPDSIPSVDTSAEEPVNTPIADTSAETFDNIPTADLSEEISAELSEPEYPEYSFDYSAQSASAEEVTPAPVYAEPVSEENISDSAFDDDTAAAPAENPSSYEWYGREVVRTTMPADTGVRADVPIDAPKKAKASKNTPVAVLLILCILLSAVFGGGSALLVNYFSNANKQTSNGGLTINQVSPDSGTNADGEKYELATVDIVDTAADSVVEIITEYVKTGSFAQQYIESGAGSGVIIDSTGYIVTNHHVIESAQKITVTLRTGESLDASVVGSDSQMDIALLKVDTEEELPAAVFGDSDTLKVGEKTVAIGNPLGQLGGTVTEGIISALDRDVVVDGQTMNLLQTDTAINPGNSGGGLFDAQGNLIGVVVAKSSGSEVEGLGFAIPINDAVDVISDLMEYGYVRGRIDIGMEFIDVNSIQTAWMYGLSELGCYVYSVDRGSNAETVGFRSGDRIVKVGDTEVSASDDIEQVLSSKAVGEEIVFTIERGGATGEVTLTLEEYVPEMADTQEDDDSYIQWNNYSN